MKKITLLGALSVLLYSVPGYTTERGTDDMDQVLGGKAAAREALKKEAAELVTELKAAHERILEGDDREAAASLEKFMKEEEEEAREKEFTAARIAAAQKRAAEKAADLSADVTTILTAARKAAVRKATARKAEEEAAPGSS